MMRSKVIFVFIITYLLGMLGVNAIEVISNNDIQYIRFLAYLGFGTLMVMIGLFIAGDDIDE